MKKLLNKIGWCLIKKTCRHEWKEHVFTDWQERCYIYECPDCKQDIYQSMD